MADAPEATELALTEEAGEMEMVETEVEEQSGMVIDAAEEAVEETIEDESAEEIAAEAPEETVDFEVTTEEYAAEAPEETVDFEVGTEEKPAEPAVLENEDDSSEDDSDSE
jgi:hypothetical protein